MKLGRTQPLYEHVVALCPESAEWQLGATVTIKENKRQRSTDQNSRYWSLATAIANYSGMTKDEVHQEALIDFHGEEVVEFRGRYVRRPRGRSSNLTTSEFSALMMILEKWVGDMQIPWQEDAA